MKENLIVSEYTVILSQTEIEQILLYAHDNLGAMLVHLENTQKYRVSNSWLFRRVTRLKLLIAKLESLLDQNNEENETTRHTDRDRGDQPQ
jgi:DNA repair exonuclease SbcCD ATPase subunit